MSNAQFKSHYSASNAQFVENYQSAATSIVINCTAASISLSTVTSQVVFTEFGGGYQFRSHYASGNAQFKANYIPGNVGAGTLTLATDIDLGNVSSSLSSITNPTALSPQVNISTRFNGVRHWHFALDGGEGKTPHFVINRARLEASNFLSTNIPCYTTDFVNWTYVTNVQRIGSYSGTIEFDTDALPAGTVYFANAPLGRYIDSTLFIADMLTNHSSIASPTSSADVNGVYYTSPAETDDLGRAVGGNPQRAIKLAWGGATTDGRRKRKMVVLTQIHSAGESQSWTTFLDTVDWMMNSVSAEAVAFRSNFEVYIYCPVTPNGLRSGTMRVNPSRVTDPNRDWYLTSSSALLEIGALRTAIEADTGGSCDILFSWHGFWVYSQDYIIGATPDDMNVSTRAPVAHEMITYGSTLFGASPNMQTSGTNNTDCWWGYAKLGAKASFDVEIHGSGNTARSNYTTIAENWMLMVHHVDSLQLLAEEGDATINCAPAPLTITGQTAQVILSGGAGGGEINAAPASININGATATIISGGSIPEPPPVNTNYASWLNDQSAIRCILVEVQAKSGGSEVNRFLSSRPFRSSSTDIPASTIYNPRVIGSSVSTVERLEVTSNAASISYGDIEVDNHDGSIDTWLDDIWSNRAIRVYLGDVRWTRAEFQPVFDGVVEDIGSRSRTTLNLKLRDKLQRLNTPVTEATLGGTTNNKNQLLPLLFGECHNITPLLTNPATLEYQVHNGIVERIVEIRDNGVPVGGTATLSTGKFTLNASPAGKITCTAQGDKPSGTWNNTAKKIIERLVTAYGEPNTRFTSGDLDTSSLTAFDAANTQTLGIYLSGRENVISICNRVASTVGSRLVMTRDGKLKLVKIELPASGTAFAITNADVITGSLYISRKIEVKAGIKLAYCKNWSVQDNLDTRIPSSHKVLHSQEWLLTVSRDSTVKSDYRIDGEPEQEETLFLTEAHASAEATRLLTLFKTPRYIVNFKATARLFQLQLGQAVALTYPRFGLDAGKSGMVVGLSPDWDKGLVDVEIFV